MPSGINTIIGSVANPIGYAPLFMEFVHSSTDSGKYYEAKGFSGITDSSGAYLMTSVTYNTASNQFDCCVKTWANWGGGTLTFYIVIFADILTGTVLEIPSTGDYGTKISKTGYDIKSAKDANLSTSSKYGNLSVFDSQETTTTSSGGYIRTITHNLGYVPIFMSFQETPVDTTKAQRLPNLYFCDYDIRFAYQYATTTTLVIKDQGYTGNPDITYRYFIFNEVLV